MSREIEPVYVRHSKMSLTKTVHMASIKISKDFTRNIFCTQWNSRDLWTVGNASFNGERRFNKPYF